MMTIDQIKTDFKRFLSSRMCVDRVFVDVQKHHTRISFTTQIGPKSALLSNECKNIILESLTEHAETLDMDLGDVTWTTTASNGGHYNRLSVRIENADGVVNDVIKIDFSRAMVQPGSHKVDCPYCGKQAKFSTSSTFIYRREYGPVYFCDCKPEGVYVGCHPNTSSPLGHLADAELRALRKQVHAKFDKYWLWANEGTERRKLRTEMYAHLANAMQIPKSECHVSHFDVERANYALEVINNGKFAASLPPLIVAKVEMSHRRAV